MDDDNSIGRERSSSLTAQWRPAASSARFCRQRLYVSSTRTSPVSNSRSAAALMAGARRLSLALAGNAAQCVDARDVAGCQRSIAAIRASAAGLKAMRP